MCPVLHGVSARCATNGTSLRAGRPVSWEVSAGGPAGSLSSGMEGWAEGRGPSWAAGTGLAAEQRPVEDAASQATEKVTWSL